MSSRQAAVQRKKYPLRRITTIASDVDDFTSFLWATFSHSDWMARTETALAYRALKTLNFRRPIRLTSEDVSAACTYILKEKIGLDEEFWTDPIQGFLEHVVGVGELPFLKRIELLDRACTDLAEVENLLTEYESLEVVKRYTTEGYRGTNQNELTILTFYRRALRAHREITTFISVSLDATALRAARESLPVYRTFGGFQFREPPYSLRSPWTEEIDWRNINPCRHRLMEVSLREARRLTEVYRAGHKSRFYKALHKVSPPQAVFAAIFDTCSRQPELSSRLPIFKELHRLYKRSQWLPFAALSLPQVEGLFAEMLKLADPASLGKALPDKVRRLRKYYSYHIGTFDYFEHLLPLTRNSFAHAGILEEPKFTALDLLHDLGFLMHLFEELDVPSMALRRTIANPQAKLTKFSDAVLFLRTILEARKANQLGGIEQKVKDFAKTYFTSALPLDKLVEGLTARTASDILELSAHLRQKSGLETDIASAKTGELRGILPALVSAFLSVCTEHEELLESLDDTLFFAKNAQKEFDFLSATHLKAVLDAHSQFWKNLELLRKAAKQPATS